MDKILAYKVLADATLKSRTKEDLIDTIRILEHNWASAEERFNNSAKNSDKIFAEQKAEIERLNNRISDMEFVGKGNCIDCKLVEDTHTLDTKYNELKEKTFSYETELLELREDRERFRARNAELQKQVDELKDERENMQAEIMATEEARLQAVKDTAKEILTDLSEYYFEAMDNTDCAARFDFWCRKYGVEVE